MQVWGVHNPEPYLVESYGENWHQNAWRGHDHLKKNDEDESSFKPFSLDENDYKPAEPMGPLIDHKEEIQAILRKKFPDFAQE